MPHLFERLKKKLPRKLDRRVKLTDKQRKEIRESSPLISHNALAAQYGVSKRTIQFIRDPQKLAENRLRREERGGWKQYYDVDKRNAVAKEHRHYKLQLQKEGKLC